MADETELADYLRHLDARLKSEQGRKVTPEEEQLAVLPDAIRELCASNPRQCLALIVRALQEPLEPQLVRMVGDGVLGDLLNERSGVIAEEVSELIRSDVRFRQAFAFGKHASVDPAVIDDWVKVFQDLGTTKAAMRKSVFKKKTS